MRSIVASVIVSALLGCGGGAGTSSCPPFVQIVAGETGRTGDRLWWTLEVDEMPAALTFNQADIPAFSIEYRWAIDLDVNEDGRTDLQAAVAHFKESGLAEATSPDILQWTQENLWAIEPSGVGSTTGAIDVTLTGNTFRIEVGVSEDAGLAQITKRSQSTWKTLHRFGPNLTDLCEDSLR